MVSDIKMLADDEDYIILTVVNDKYLVNFILGMKPPKLTKSRELDNRRWVMDFGYYIPYFDLRSPRTFHS